jgi:hypothetical protein
MSYTPKFLWGAGGVWGNSDISWPRPDALARGLDHVGLLSMTWVYASARVLSVSLRQAQRFAPAEARVPRSVVKLLRLMVRFKVRPDEV